MKAKRVILRLRASEFEDFAHDDYFKVVQSFLIFSGRSDHEVDEDKHFYRVEPLNPEIAKPNARFHIIIDLEKSQFNGALGQNFPHDVYRVRRDNDKL
jgi:hypothetical protein